MGLSSTIRTLIGGTLPFSMLAAFGNSELFLLLLARVLDALGDDDCGGGVATRAGVASGAGDFGKVDFTVGNPAGRSEELE